MTQQPDRLDRIESILATLAESLSRTENIVQSNARAIQAAEARAEEERIRTRQTLDDLNSFVRSLTQRALENLIDHEVFKQEMRQFREAINEFRTWVKKGGKDGDN